MPKTLLSEVYERALRQRSKQESSDPDSYTMKSSRADIIFAFLLPLAWHITYTSVLLHRKIIWGNLKLRAPIPCLMALTKDTQSREFLD